MTRKTAIKVWSHIHKKGVFIINIQEVKTNHKELEKKEC